MLLSCIQPWHGTASAQPPAGSIEQIRRPAQQELPEPDYAEPREAPRFVLPPLVPALPAAPPAAQLTVYVSRIELQDNRILPPAEVTAVSAGYTGRVITTGELIELRDRLTRLCIDRGYINSGVVIPDQQVRDGVIFLRLIEGELTTLNISGNRRLQADYIADRVHLGAGKPLNVNDLQLELRLLQESPLLERINATLVPGRRPGESVLGIDVAERRPWRLRVAADNHRAPSVGSLQGTLYGEHLNLSGRGDELRGSISLTEGLRDLFLEYRMPVSARDAQVGIHVERTAAEVVEEPFDVLDIESDSRTLGLSYSYPLIRRPGESLRLGLQLERRHSRTTLAGDGFPFADGVSDNGESDVTALRISQDWTRRSRDQVLALRSVFSFGLDLFGATRNTDPPDGRFIHWLGRFQWARRIGASDTELVLRADTQLSVDRLLPLEKFVVGGAATVRGYRENQLVRDNGVVTSLELRIPILQAAGGTGRLRLAPFLDAGRSWNHGRSAERDDLAAAGLGLLYDRRRLHARAYWADALDPVATGSTDHDLQDDGIHFSVSYELP